jgi:hypothetical protein
MKRLALAALLACLSIPSAALAVPDGGIELGTCAPPAVYVHPALPRHSSAAVTAAPVAPAQTRRRRRSRSCA